MEEDVRNDSRGIVPISWQKREPGLKCSAIRVYNPRRVYTGHV